jgi:hypothetical protein
MAKVGLLADLHPEVFCRTYNFRFWEDEVAIYPLAALCALGAPQKLIEFVFDLCPAAARDAVNVECRYAKNVDLLQFFCDKSPTVMSIPDPVEGELPLQIACQGGKLDVVRFVYDAYPEALTHKDKYGWTPFHDALFLSDIPIIEYLMERSDNNAVLRQTNKNGFTPLHYAFRNKRKKVSEFVVKRFPDFLREAREDISSAPLHYVCRKGTTIAGIKVLLENDPEASKQPDNLGRLPLALACKNEEFKNNFEVLELIVHYHPDAIDAVDNDGNLAVDVPTYRKLMKYLINKKGAPPAKRQRT